MNGSSAIWKVELSVLKSMVNFQMNFIYVYILQGSISGPILFLCFINDLPICTDLLALLFADDMAGLLSGPELGPLLNKANLELQ
jgi:hypothetical protein